MASVGSFDWEGCGEDEGIGVGTVALRFSLTLRWVDQRSCMDLLSAFGPCLPSFGYLRDKPTPTSIAEKHSHDDFNY